MCGARIPADFAVCGVRMRPDQVPEAVWARLVKRAPPPDAAKPISLIAAMQIKTELCAHLPEDQALSCYAELMRDGTGLSLRRLPLGSLGAALEEAAEGLTIAHDGQGDLHNRTPVIYGPASVPEIRNRARRIRSGWLRQATVFARSAMVLHQGRLLFDAQEDEASALPVEMAFDPVIFRRCGPGEVMFLEDDAAERAHRIPEALSLLGINTVSFGHWMMEQLPQFLAARARLGDRLAPGAGPLPILIDQHMPRQHRQSLRFFAGDRAIELVEIPRGHRVHVDRLYAVQNWFYAPHLLTTDQGLDIAAIHPTIEALTVLCRAGSAEIAARFAAAPPALPAGLGQSRRLFWARKPERHRAIDNWEEVAGWLTERGYVTCFPEELSFAEQMAAIHGADRIVVQNGSGSLGLLLAAAGTRLLYLSHPDMSRLAMQIEAHAQTGVEMRVLAGAFSKRTDRWVDQSNYRIAAADFDTALGWLDGPAKEGGS